MQIVSQLWSSGLKQRQPIVHALGHQLGVSLAAGDKARNAVAAAGLSRVAVAQVETPADVVGEVGNGAVDGLVLNEQHAADFDWTANLLAGRQVLIGDALEIGTGTQAVLVADERGAVAAGNNFHAAVFRSGIHQGNPKIDHEGLFGVGLQIAQVLMPRHHSGVLVGQLGAQVELRMSQYLRADHGFDNVEQRRLGQNGEHALGFELAVDLAQQRFRVR